MEYSVSDAFNISTGNPTKTRTVFEVIESELKTELQPNYGQNRPGDALHVTLSPQKAKEKLGWEPKTTFEEGIKKTIQFYRTSH